MNHYKKTLMYLVIFLLAAGPSACFKEIVETREPIPDMIWPKPPDVPRIRLLNSISRPNDININEGRLERFFTFLKGEKKISLVNPYGVITDNNGALYAVDTFNRVVHVFDEKNNAYYVFPEGNTSFISPIDIAIDSKDTIYVSDSTDAVVKIFRDRGKKYVGEIGRGLLERPTGIAFNSMKNEILVVDTKGSAIVRYDANTLKVKGIFGKVGNTDGFFYNPTNIFTTHDGEIIVSDSLNFRIQVLSPEGKFLSTFGAAGDGPGYFSRPRGVAADSEGHIYVVDALFDNVQVFDKSGRLLMYFGRSGGGYGEFWLPSGIYIDTNDRIYVSDSYNHRIQVFKYLKEEEFIKQ